MKLKGLFSFLVAAISGIIVLLGYFLPSIAPLSSLSSMFLAWASILGGIALLVGVSNLFSVHLDKIRKKPTGSGNSMALLMFFLLTLLVGVFRSDNFLQDVLLNNIMVPIETSLAALLAITLVYASIRLLSQRTDLRTILFLVVTLVVLLGSAPWPMIGNLPIVSDLVRPFVAQVLAAGGARGMLIGIALGTLMTGLRVIFGADRPYGGK